MVTQRGVKYLFEFTNTIRGNLAATGVNQYIIGPAINQIPFHLPDHETDEHDPGRQALYEADEGDLLWPLCCWRGPNQNRSNAGEVNSMKFLSVSNQMNSFFIQAPFVWRETHSGLFGGGGHHPGGGGEA